jgi:hypothetical protein
MYEGGLEEGSIFSDHPAAGNWEALQGGHCATWETPTMESRSTGDSRHQTTTKSPEWNSTIIVQTGSTKGGRDAKYDSDLPNH